MKYCSAATDAIMASGSYVLYGLYDVTLVTGQTYHFTDGEVQLNNVTLYVPGVSGGTTIGPFTYKTGLTIINDELTQKAGTEAGQMKLTLVPQAEASILIAGYTLPQAARFGFLQGATVRYSQCYLNPPSPTTGALDTSPGAMGFFLGTIQDVAANTFFVDIGVEDALSILGIQQMPQNLLGVGCFHQVYDPGCGLLKATFSVSGAIVTAGDGAHFTTNLTQADDYFDLGGFKMTSGAANGQSANISSFKHTSGAIALLTPFSVAPSPGDTFTAYPGCDRQFGTCGTKFSNTGRFAGAQWVPESSTIVDGGTIVPPTQAPGAQAGQLIGSQPAARYNYGPYKP